MIEVSRLKDENAAELFLGFRIGAISRRDFAVFPVQGQRGLRRLKRYFGDKMSVGAQMVVVLKAFVERCVSLVLGHPFEFSGRDVSQTDVCQCSSPLGRSQRHSGRSFFYHCFKSRSATPPHSTIFASTSFTCNLSRRLTPSNNRLP